MIASSDLLAVERGAAAESRAYHETVWDGFPLDDRRRDLARFAADFYKNRLGVHETRESREAIDAVSDPDTALIVISHDGQLPHLGIVRMVLKAHDIASLDRRAMTLYLIGNHYSAAMKRANLRFGMPMTGRAPDDLERPPQITPERRSQTPFRWLPPPAEPELELLMNKLADIITLNVGHERSAGGRPAPNAKETMTARLHDLFDLLIRAAAETSSFGDWLIRVQHDLFHRMLGAEANRIVFLPTADLTDLFRGELTTVAERADEVAAIKDATSAEQLSRGEEPYQGAVQASSFWIYCPACFRRTRHPFHPRGLLEFACPFCGSRHVLEGEAAWKWTMPDVVAYRVGLLRLGTDAWVVGSHAPYHPVIERAYARLFQSEMPPKFFLTSKPMFRGIGEPSEGYARTRLLRALLEIEPSALAAGLRAPWGEAPRLQSDLLRVAHVGGES